MAIYFFDKNQTLIKIVPESATFEAIQTQELDDDSLLKDTLSVTVKGDEKLINAEYMAVKSYKGNAQTFDMYRIVTDTTPDKSMSFTGMSLAPYELNGHILQDLRPVNHSLSYTLNRVLTGTDWRLGYVDSNLSNVTTTFYYVSVKEALKELQSLVGCEFVFKVEISGQKITDKWIEVYSEMGNRTKKRFNYGTNALTVVRETNKADIFTALIGRGKGEEVSSGEDNASGQAGYGRKITFEDIEWKKSSGKPLDKPIGQYYLELPQATQAYGIKNIDGTMKARVGIVDFDDEEDKNRLINRTYQQLLVSSRPKVLFKTTVANIGATGIGDTVTIHRHDLNIHYQTRVRKIVRNKLNDNKTQIELGDAVVTASTKQTKRNNATIKNLNNEIDKIKANVATSQNSADGKNTIFYGSAEPERQRTGDTWYRPHPSIAGETQMLTWNGTAWELVIDTSDLTSVSRAVEDVSRIAGEAVQAAKDADEKANSAIEKAGANANLLTTHQNTIDTINTVTLPDIASTAGTALADAKSAMDEAKEADNKIANFVTANGLVSGTTVDTKINDATGEISKKITAVEGKIDGLQVGGRNLLLNSSYIPYAQGTEVEYKGNLATKIKSSTRANYSQYVIEASEDLIQGETYTYSALVAFEGEKPDNIQFYLPPISIYTNVDGFEDLEEGKYGRVYITRKAGKDGSISRPHLHINGGDGYVYFTKWKLEKGTIATDWTPAPEDNLSQSEFQIFESTYNEDVKGINSTLTELSNKKLDGTTYTDFYTNEYKKTAQGVTDTYAKVNKIIDANGNTTDSFAKAVYDQNATRRTEDFNEVTKDLVKEATYTAGISGILNRLTAIDSSDPNSVVTRLNTTESTANGNTVTISNIKKSPEENITGYQTIKERSDLYERVIGKDEAGVKGNISRIVQASDVIQTEVAKMDLASGSEISTLQTQLADSWGVKIKSADEAMASLSVNTSGARIAGKNILLDGNTSVNGAFWAKEVNAIKVNADNITTGTLDGSRIRANSIDTNRLTGNISEFIRTYWQQANGQHVRIDGTGMFTTGTGDWRRTYFTPTGMDLFNGQGNKAGAIGYFKANRDYTNGNYGDENIMWGDRLRHTIGVGVNYNHVLSLGYVSSQASVDNGYNDALTVDPQASGKVSIYTSLDMLSRPIENAYRLNFRHGGYIFGQQNSSMYYNASLRHDLAISGSTKFAVDGTIRAYTGIDMNGNDISRIGKFSYNSDERLKTNIKQTTIKALEAIERWKLVEYDWLENGEHVEIGLIAQNTPELMTYSVESDIYGIDAGKQTMINTLAIQQLDSKTNNEVAQLKTQVASLQEELALLKGD